MPESDRYTTISIRQGLKDELARIKTDDETYSDIIRRVLATEGQRADRDKERHNFTHDRLNEQSRLLVRIADELDMTTEQIPKNMAEYEAWGANDPFTGLASDEETTDVFSEEKNAKMQARDEILDPENDEDDMLHGGRISQEQEEAIRERTAEILAENEEKPDTDDKPEFLKGGDN